MNARFLVFADLHADVMHDPVSRVRRIARAAVESKARFLIGLGDIQYPELPFLRRWDPEAVERFQASCPPFFPRDDEKTEVRRLLRETGLPLYMTIGNHDTHFFHKETICRYWGMPGPYYDFVQGGVRFLVLDTNFIDTGNGLIPYERGSQKAWPAERYWHLPANQLRWLEDTLMASEEPCVLLSHVSLADDIASVHNRSEVWEIIRRAREHGRRVLCGFNGHGHIDGCTWRAGTPFFNVNSAAYSYMGEQYRAERFGPEISRRYPKICATAPYREALWVVVEIDETGVHISGSASQFEGPSPREMGFPDEENFYPPRACVRDRRVSFPPSGADA